MSQQLKFFKKDIDQSAPKQLKEFEPLLNKLKMKDKEKWNFKKANNNLKYVIPVYKRCIFIFFLICEVHAVKSRQGWHVFRQQYFTFKYEPPLFKKEIAFKW